jgi:hypothetical protein
MGNLSKLSTYEGRNPTSTKPPIGAVYSYAKNNPEDTIYWILGARDGKDEDLSDIAKRTAAIDKAEDKYNNVEVKVITTSDAGMSGTNARKALLAGNRRSIFINFYLLK